MAFHSTGFMSYFTRAVVIPGGLLLCSVLLNPPYLIPNRFCILFQILFSIPPGDGVGGVKHV